MAKGEHTGPWVYASIIDLSFTGLPWATISAEAFSASASVITTPLASRLCTKRLYYIPSSDTSATVVRYAHKLAATSLKGRRFPVAIVVKYPVMR